MRLAAAIRCLQCLVDDHWAHFALVDFASCSDQILMLQAPELRELNMSEVCYHLLNEVEDLLDDLLLFGVGLVHLSQNVLGSLVVLVRKWLILNDCLLADLRDVQSTGLVIVYHDLIEAVVATLSIPFVSTSLVASV